MPRRSPAAQNLSDPISVALVDDDAMALAHLQSYFSDSTEFEIRLSTGSVHEALQFLQTHQVDVIISEIHIHSEEMDGVAMTEEVLRSSSQTRVILLTSLDTDSDLMRGLAAGASGFLLKSAPPQEILAAVRAVHSGAKVVAPVPTARLIAHALASVRRADGSIEMSEREADVLHLLCEGASNRAIAERLSIAEATVKSHISVLFTKTGTSSRLEMVVWAFHHGYASQEAPAAG